MCPSLAIEMSPPVVTAMPPALPLPNVVEMMRASLSIERLPVTLTDTSPEPPVPLVRERMAASFVTSRLPVATSVMLPPLAALSSRSALVEMPVISLPP
jgi:hypothetical protein